MKKEDMSPAQTEDAALLLEQDFVAIVREEIGMHEGLAAIVASALVRGLRKKLGGQELWIPAPDKSQRDAAIRREFIGTNIKEIMSKYGLSRPRVYQIVGMSSAKAPSAGGKSSFTP